MFDIFVRHVLVRIWNNARSLGVSDVLLDAPEISEKPARVCTVAPLHLYESQNTKTSGFTFRAVLGDDSLRFRLVPSLVH